MAQNAQSSNQTKNIRSEYQNANDEYKNVKRSIAVKAKSQAVYILPIFLLALVYRQTSENQSLSWLKNNFRI